MTKDQELQEIRRYIWEEVEGYDLTWNSHRDALAEKLYKDGWHRERKGEWLKVDGYGFYRQYECSYCRKQSPSRFDYCQNCGAKMI